MIPAPSGYFYQIVESLNSEELALVKQVRAFMEAKVAPMINKYLAVDRRRRAMLRKTLMTLSVSAMLGTAVIAPNAALAFFLPPHHALHLGGLLPHPGLGGLPPHLGRGGAPGLSRRGGPPGFQGGYSGRYGYGQSGRRGRGGGYGVYGYGNDAGAPADDGCYYTYSRQRRVLVCDEN